MNWKLKALGQKAVGTLPEQISYSLYDLLQKSFGRMNQQNVNPTRLLKRTALIVAEILQQNQTVEGKTFLEVGTGWKLTTPMALWLCGAEKVFTVDLNPYLRPDLVQLEAEYIIQHKEEVATILSEVASESSVTERIERLKVHNDFSLSSLLELMCIEYMAPADAAKLPQLSNIDYHLSHTVFEHIPEEILLAILHEARRLLAPDGLCVHYIDPSDHFAHRDQSISEINFLQYSDRQWKFWADNRYAYHNRLRVDDYERLFEQADLEVLNTEVERNEQAMLKLSNGFPLTEQFRTKSKEINASTKLLITARNKPKKY